MNAGADFRAEQTRRNKALAEELEAKGIHRDAIAVQLGLSRKTVGGYLGPPKRPEPPPRKETEMHDKTEPVGDLPTWISPTVKDYERDTREADAPDVRMWGNQERSPEQQRVIGEGLLQAREREASVVAMGRR